MTSRVAVVCERCGDILGKAESQTHAICNKCLDLYFPHHADLIRTILEVETIEDLFIS